MPNLIKLDELSVTNLELVGGKAANLAALLQAGFPAPDGFVLTAQAYQTFIQDSGLEHLVRKTAQQASEISISELETAAGELAQAFVTAEMPEEIAEDLRKAYQELGEGPVAVRSSATVEDQPEASFAGQQVTYLNVLGEEDLFSAVTLCWASLWSARALTYRSRSLANDDSIRLAVIVQKMVRAEVAGVLFTANPTTRDPNEIVINATQGLGEAVGSGEVTPDETHINRSNWTVVHSETQNPPFAPDAAYLELAHLGERIELLFGVPQDIEWAWCEGDFFILQARPITTPVAPRLRWDPPHPGSIYTREGVMQLLQEPVSTLFETVGLPALSKAMLGAGSNTFLETINGYVYARVTTPPSRPPTSIFKKIFHHETSAMMRWQAEALPTYRQAVAGLRGEPGKASARELLSHISALAAACAQYWLETSKMLAEAKQAEQRFQAIYQYLRREGDAETGLLVRSRGSRSLEAEQVLYAARQGSLDEYVREFGYALYSLDFAVPLAGEDCSAIEASLRAWEHGAPSPNERQAGRIEEQRAAEERIRAHLEESARRSFDQALASARTAATNREDALFELGLAWAPLRAYALELGRRLKTANALEEPSQVFWLRWNELGVLAAGLDEGKERLPSQAAKAKAREVANVAARDVKAPANVPETAHAVAKMGRPSERHEPEAGNIVTGTSASPGRVTGVARVIRNSQEFERLGQGEILVTRATTPAWTPLFTLSAGLVTDQGGTLSHGAIVAREYGIPAVMGTGDATARIRDGQTITVDGTAGVVYLAADDSSAQADDQ